MSNLLKKDGYSFSFNPKACESCGGKCCTGDSGYIWINIVEIERLSKHLNLTIDEFSKKYLYKVRYKYSLKEIELEPNVYSCCFFDNTNKMCSIYEFRPNQCRTFPFWDYFKTNKEELKKECIGILDL
ncbi:YkgJ family cysteine cluster protein [Aliarcobacter skirrowii]|uniref:YkgJ family cysteine cluster protein n=1 Tax=Aliarcobacter skirrowii TaxID=28200 RepID=UPI0029B1FAA0|nr:YkgJ family cysteine cluster protein [Aliarcobacter skirrowii]MDX4063948.1 YkgJ family cysteine cluster protein [Aliarcobacter skirrowii]